MRSKSVQMAPEVLVARDGSSRLRAERGSHFNVRLSPFGAAPYLKVGHGEAIAAASAFVHQRSRSKFEAS